jgi:hypothetical protein
VPKVNVYLADTLAEQVRSLQLPVSAICQRALAQEVHRMDALQKLNGKIELLEVDMRDEERSWEISFDGVWLIGPGDGVRSSDEYADAGAEFSVALTRKGQLAVYVRHCNDRWAPTFNVFPTLDDAELPDDIAALVASDLGIHRPIYMDI